MASYLNFISCGYSVEKKIEGENPSLAPLGFKADDVNKAYLLHVELNLTPRFLNASQH